MTDKNTVSGYTTSAPTIAGVSDGMVGDHGNQPSGAVVGDTHALLSGTGTPGSVMTIRDGGTVLGTARVPDSGQWTFFPPQPLDEGTHQLTASLDSGPSSQPFELTVDTSILSVPSIQYAGDHLDSGANTDDTHLTLHGTARANSVVTIFDGGEKIGIALVGADGSWSYQSKTALAQGEHHFTVGNSSGAVSQQAFDVTVGTPAAAQADMASMSVAHDAAPSATMAADDFILPRPIIDTVYSNQGPWQGYIGNGATTLNAQPVIGGSAEPGTWVSIYDGNTLLKTVQSNDRGRWSFVVDKPLDDHAQHAFVAKSEGAPDSVPPYVINVDSVVHAPTIDHVYDDASGKQIDLHSGQNTLDTTPTLVGTTVANGMVAIYDGGKLVDTVQATANGQWSYPLQLGEGSHAISTSLGDSPAGNAFVINVEAAVSVPAPGLSIDYADDHAGAQQGHIASGATTDDTHPTLHGTGPANAVVKVLDNGVAVGTVFTDKNGAWTFESKTALSGDHQYTVTSLDGSTVSQPFVVHIEAPAPAPQPAPVIAYVYDDVGPSQSFLSNGANTDDARPLLIGSAQPNSLVTIYDGDSNHPIGTALADPSGTWRFTPDADLSNGTHSLVASTANSALSEAFVIHVIPLEADRTPTIAYVYDDVGNSTGYLANGANTDDARPLLIGSAQPNSLVTIYDGDSNHPIGTAQADPSGTWRFTPDADLSNGTHHLVAGTANSALSAEFVINVDTVAHPPMITGAYDHVGNTQGDLQSGATTDDTRPVLSGTAAAGDTVSIFDGGKLIGTAYAENNGHWSFTPNAALLDGTHSLTVSVPGQAASDPFVITVNTVAPPPVLAIQFVDDQVGSQVGHMASGSTIDDTRPTIYGTAAANTTVTLYDGDNKLGIALVNKNGEWTYRPNTPLAEGDHNLTVVARDGSSGESFTIHVDTHAASQFNSLSVGDVLAGGEMELFAAHVPQDDARLSVHDIAASQSAPESMAMHVPVAMHEVASNAALLLPHEQMTAHVM
ncbi:hypothetical protein ISP15_14035 [Dyella jejuensis]|uniref:Uncharacterized protein n=1 Tax=Dyella jejuensis TaxID=1432009 RepID=A0ABW8JK27_9GAMM